MPFFKNSSKSRLWGNFRWGIRIAGEICKIPKHYWAMEYGKKWVWNASGMTCAKVGVRFSIVKLLLRSGEMQGTSKHWEDFTFSSIWLQIRILGPRKPPSQCFRRRKKYTPAARIIPSTEREGHMLSRAKYVRPSDRPSVQPYDTNCFYTIHPGFVEIIHQ